MSSIKRFICILKNVLMSYGITLLLFMIYSFILAFTSVPESTMSLIIFVITMISVFIGSSLAVIKIKGKGLINGGLVGLMYIMLVYILSSMFSTGFGLNGYTFLMILFSVIVGMIGGIIGVNMKREG